LTSIAVEISERSR